MKTVRFWLLMLTVMALTAPLGAQEIDAPEAHWKDVSAQSSTANAPGDGSAEKPAGAENNHERGRKLTIVVNDASTARPLTVGEKWKLFYPMVYDPLHFASTAVGAAISQANDTFPEYGQGMEGYGKRYGADFGDSSMGAFFGSFLLPSLLHDDPRYFRKGSGPFMSRLLHGASYALVARRDDGTSHPNFSIVLGSFMACGIGNLYYPEGERGAGTTFERGAGLIASSSAQGVLHEFWPDIRNKIFKRHRSEP